MKVEQGGDRYRIMAEINMVPLIDIALVLLIIFMVMTPILVSSQIKLNLPGASTGKDSKEKTVEVQIDKAGQMHMNGKVVSDEMIKDMIKGATANPSGDRHGLLISCDKEAMFGKAVTVMDIARQVGVQKMSIAVKRQLSGSKH